MKYLYILFFLMTHDLTNLKEYWRVEFIKKSNFSWINLIKTFLISSKEKRFYFWWRLANELFLTNEKAKKRIAGKIQNKQKRKNNVEIMLGAKIGKGFKIIHFYGIIITNQVIIGEYFTCHQLTTIGVNKNPCNINIGNNVEIGTNSVIIGGNVKIGNNVKVGAMSFINKDIPNNCTVYTKKENKCIIHQDK